MRLIRTILFWTHLSVGLAVGIIIFIMCVSGVLLSFEDWAIALCDGHRAGLVPAGASFVWINKMLTNSSAAKDLGMPSGLLIHSDLSAPIAVTFGPEKTLLFNSVSGENVGEGCSTARAFFRKVNEWHRWLGRAEPSRSVGRAISGACNLSFLFLLASGVILRFPRTWSFKNLKSLLAINPSLRGRARDWNWHTVVGFWSSIPLFFIVTSGVITSYPWANRLLFRMAGSEPPATRRSEARRDGGNERRPLAKMEGIDRVFRKIQADFPEWKTIRARFMQNGSVTFAIDSGSGRPQQRIQITAKVETGEITRQERPADYERGRRWRLLARFLHTGEAAGLVGQTLASVASAGGAVLVCTGFSLALRRFLRRGLSPNGTRSLVAETTAPPPSGK